MNTRRFGDTALEKCPKCGSDEFSLTFMSVNYIDWDLRFQPKSCSICSAGKKNFPEHLHVKCKRCMFTEPRPALDATDSHVQRLVEVASRGKK